MPFSANNRPAGNDYEDYEEKVCVLKEKGSINGVRDQLSAWKVLHRRQEVVARVGNCARFGAARRTVLLVVVVVLVFRPRSKVVPLPRLSSPRRLIMFFLVAQLIAYL